jgi:hypothetical protein
MWLLYSNEFEMHELNPLPDEPATTHKQKHVINHLEYEAFLNYN